MLKYFTNINLPAGKGIVVFFANRLHEVGEGGKGRIALGRRGKGGGGWVEIMNIFYN